MRQKPWRCSRLFYFFPPTLSWSPSPRDCAVRCSSLVQCPAPWTRPPPTPGPAQVAAPSHSGCGTSPLKSLLRTGVNSKCLGPSHSRVTSPPAFPSSSLHASCAHTLRLAPATPTPSLLPPVALPLSTVALSRVHSLPILPPSHPQSPQKLKATSFWKPSSASPALHCSFSGTSH